MMDEQKTKPVYRVLLYYQFVPIADPEAMVVEHKRLCDDLALHGRILIAPNGINGTVSGTVEACQRYKEVMNADERFSQMVFKSDDSEDHVFEKMFVRYKDELVTFRVGHDIDPNQRTGRHLQASEFHKKLQDEDIIVLDGRTGYEWDVGHFRGAIRPDVDSFRDFPAWIRENMSDLKGRQILTYCTGGVRCELLTAYMLEEGFDNVYQLDGGIVTYGKDQDVQGSLWDGQCYVFDERITVGINHTEDFRVVGKCHHCGGPTERYMNCSNMECNLQHLCCEECEEKMQRSCSEECRHAEHRKAV